MAICLIITNIKQYKTIATSINEVAIVFINKELIIHRFELLHIL